MRKNVLNLLFVVGSSVIGGCGTSLQEVIVDASLSSAKESIEEAVDEAVESLVDEVVGFAVPDSEGELPNE